MRLFLTAVVIVLFSVGQGNPVSGVEVRMGVRLFDRGLPGGQAYSDLAFGLSGPFGEGRPFGWYAFGQIHPGWAQAYAGWQWFLTPAFSLHAAAGFQQADGERWREQVNLGFGLDNDDIDFWVDIEADGRLFRGNGSALWYEVAVMKKSKGRTSLGLHARRGFGTGPHVDFRPGDRLPIRLSASWLPFSQEPWNGDIPDLAWRRGHLGLKFVF